MPNRDLGTARGREETLAPLISLDPVPRSSPLTAITACAAVRPNEQQVVIPVPAGGDHEVEAFVDIVVALRGVQLSEAQRLADGLLNALGARDHAPAETPKVVEDRQRAVTLLVLAWNELRRGLNYTRWSEGDVDAIAPFLYKREPSRKADVAPEAPVNGGTVATDE